MYAVVKTGGRQYRVEPGDTIDVERLSGEVGETIDLNPVLMVGNGDEITVGTPAVDTARVTAEIVEHKRGKKIVVFKFQTSEKLPPQTRASAISHLTEDYGYSGI